MGIDTPETVHTQKEEQPYGQEASNYTKTRLENGDKIELEYDSNSSEKDKYGMDLDWWQFIARRTCEKWSSQNIYATRQL